MPGCSGNDYMIIIDIGYDSLSIYSVHEKVEFIDKQIYDPYSINTSCLLDSHAILLYDREYAVEDDRYIRSLTTHVYGLIMKEDRTQAEERTLEQFNVLFDTFLTDYKQSNTKKLSGSSYHNVILFPDEWDSRSFQLLFEKAVEKSFKAIDQHTLYYSNALIRYLQHPYNNITFKNGTNCIVCIITNEMDSYFRYEIGRPIKGLHSVAQYHLSTYSKIEALGDNRLEYYIMKYLEARHLGTNPETTRIYKNDMMAIRQSLDLSSLYYDTYNHPPSLHEADQAMEHYFSIFTSEMYSKPSQPPTEAEIEEAIYKPFFEPISNQVSELSRDLHNTKIILCSDNKSGIYAHNYQYFIRTLPKDYHHIYHKIDNIKHVYASGATYSIQDLLKINNYVPNVINIVPLKRSLSNGFKKTKVLFTIDIDWEKTSISCITIDFSNRMIESDNRIRCTCPPINHAFVGWPVYKRYELIINSQLVHFMNARFDAQLKYYSKYDLKENSNAWRNPSYSISKKTKRRAKLAIESVSSMHMIDDVTEYLRSQYKDVYWVDLTWTIDEMFEYSKYAPSKIKRYTVGTRRRYLRTFLSLYLGCIVQQITSTYESPITKSEPLEYQYAVTIAQPILDSFFIDTRQELKELLVTNTLLKQGDPDDQVILKDRSHAMAVHCVQELKVYETIEDHLDYPKYVLLTEMHPYSIRFAFNQVSTLCTKVKFANDETVLTLKSYSIRHDPLAFMTDTLWDFIQTLIGKDDLFLFPCKAHVSGEYHYTVDAYLSYEAVFSQFFKEEFSFVNGDEEINWDEPLKLPIYQMCTCYIHITRRDVLDIAIHPAIIAIASAVREALLNTFPLQTDTFIDYLAVTGFPIETHCAETREMIRELMKIEFRHNMRYIPTHIQWMDDGRTVSEIVKEGIYKSIIYPKNSLLEQVMSGTYAVQMDPNHQAYYDSECLNPWSNKKHPIVKKGTRITNTDREDGYSLQLYYKESIENACTS
ncbi:hypothetical protein BDB01DRAFT_806722 [Pilobolus umbonatus]|nr:hypothetical protein BDB01DRAFT_806722 [Pilobolus umbonatus]